MTAAARSGPAPSRPARSEAAAALPDRIAFLGLGLIGGSIALALREAGYEGTLAAWTPGGTGPAEALERSIIDEVADAPSRLVEDAGLVLLAGPPLTIVEHLGARAGWRSALDEKATVTDVGSTKARILEAADAAGLPFVGGHPMAGRESTGVAAATGDLFVDRPWVVVPGAHARPHDVTTVEALATATGARPRPMGADEHDAAVAAISHLPLVVAAALVESVAGGGDAGGWAMARGLAASGWRDATRLARGDPEMGAGILATNAAAVATRLRAMRDTLDAWIEQLEGDPAGADPAGLRRRLEAARAALTGEGPGA
ncbi:MAG TPA: prephenate dehydrogenase/arogenate dehydrogenase family protein [Candidatus Limnocylindrales bacterium]|nr:prephenate dehydrogenase/arogenate dehydrogenase family protein [Candidatus Limnocylindrales bacterium]